METKTSSRYLRILPMIHWCYGAGIQEELEVFLPSPIKNLSPNLRYGVTWALLAQKNKPHIYSSSHKHAFRTSRKPWSLLKVEEAYPFR